jgi:hypothetical protein
MLVSGPKDRKFLVKYDGWRPLDHPRRCFLAQKTIFSGLFIFCLLRGGGVLFCCFLPPRNIGILALPGVVISYFFGEFGALNFNLLFVYYNLLLW